MASSKEWFPGVTETWTDLRPDWFKPIARLATGVDDRQSHTLTGAQVTLDRLAAAAEAGPSEG